MEDFIHEAQVDAFERVMERDDSDALTLVGAVIGNVQVAGRLKPGRRWHYKVEDRYTGVTKVMRGYELVRLARSAQRDGLLVLMPREPWRDEAAA